ncbi:hypothetical protein ACH95_19440 [Bacillus glycinifermentans]|uniref:hypothetical protein n=1 Tax=Bacillus glycinifermentans TaxID=1664069 RepID=UPI0006535249|nr:hypothetical protein [Bacillus glycinifermentans]KMM54870.1 hypothetical protein ACH95_19440 [Bacillus glycinifermentans]MEC0497220.1 hypothetical protein [Bacillus glycinifermentans]MEC0539551.1 hypothetical protein [Bacillus glycinifermentans]
MLWFRKKKTKKKPKNLEEVLLEWNDDEVINYIGDYSWTKKNKKAELQRIRGLEFDTIVLGIARMKRIEEAYDNSKIIPGMIAGLAFLLTQVANFYYILHRLIGAISSLILAFIIFLILTYGVQKRSSLRSRATYYRSLLEQVKSEMEKTS